MRYLLFLIFLSGCGTLKTKYDERSSQIKDYCEQVFEDAGYKDKKPHKLSMARCIYESENEIRSSDSIARPVWSIYAHLVTLYILALFGLIVG